MLTVLLTRHGHTDRSEPEQYLGQKIDVGLSERGRSDAEKLAERLAGVRIDRVISSSLQRAVETAQILARDQGVSVETDKRLIELDYGEWEGHTLEDIDRMFPGERALYESNPAIHEVGGGESGLEVAARLGRLIEELLSWWSEQGGDRTCLLVGHSSTNRVLLALLLEVPMSDYRRRFRQDWVNLTVLRWDNAEAGPLLVLANDQGHSNGIRGATWD